MIFPAEKTVHPEGYSNIVGAYVPSASMLFSESLTYGLRTMWWQEQLDEMRFDQAAGLNIIDEEGYKNSTHYRDGIQWFDGMSMQQAEIMAENHDRNLHFSQLTNNVSMFSGLGMAMMGGILVGSLPDPLNYIPFLGLSKRVVSSANMLKSIKTASQAFKTTAVANSPLTRTLLHVADPMLGAGVANFAVTDKRSKFQEQHDMKMILMDMFIAGGIGLGIAGLSGIRSRMKTINAQRHADRIAMGLEQLEAGESLNLRPHPHKGFNYQNSPDTVLRSPSGTMFSNSTKRVFDQDYLNIEVLDAGGLESGVPLVQESLELANTLGYKGIFVSDEILDSSLPVNNGKNVDVIISELGDTRVSIEHVPEAKGAVITDVLTEADGVSWDYVDTNKQFKYDESHTVIAENVQEKIRQSIGQFTEISSVAKKSIDDLMNKTKNITETVRKFGDEITDAANCIIKNG